MRLNEQTTAELQQEFKVLRKIVMVATTGRSGSLYFANLVNRNALNASAEHEPRLVPSDVSARWYYENETDKISHLVSRKLNRLYRGDRLASLPIVRQVSPRFTGWTVVRKGMGVPRVPVREVYVEVNNNFLKSFGAALLDREPAVEVVHLTRSPLLMAMSAANRGSYPDRNRPYYLWPSWEGNELRMDDDLAMKMTPFQLGLWYWVEMELRFASIRERYPHVRNFEIDLDELNDVTKVESLFRSLGIRHRELSTKVDTHKGAKPNVLKEEDLKEARQLVAWLPDGTLDRINHTYGLESA